MRSEEFRRKTGLPYTPSWIRKQQFPLSEGRDAMDLALQIEQLFRTDRKKYLGFIRQRVRNQEEDALKGNAEA